MLQDILKVIKTTRRVDRPPQGLNAAAGTWTSARSPGSRRRPIVGENGQTTHLTTGRPAGVRTTSAVRPGRRVRLMFADTASSIDEAIRRWPS